MIEDAFETELDRINKYYRNKIVTLIPALSSVQYTPEKLGEFCTGMFIEAMESGIWIMPLTGCKKDFFYHDKIIKIEESEIVDPNQLSKEQRENLEKEFKAYDDRRREEIRETEERIKERYDQQDPDNNIPDLMDPTDDAKNMELIKRVQDQVRENLKENYLDKRKKSDPEQED